MSSYPSLLALTMHSPLSCLTHGTHTDLGCTFQEDLCGFEVDGEGDFKFERFNGDGVPIIGADHNENKAGIFLYAHAEALQDPTPVLY